MRAFKISAGVGGDVRRCPLAPDGRARADLSGIVVAITAFRLRALGSTGAGGRVTGDAAGSAWSHVGLGDPAHGHGVAWGRAGWRHAEAELVCTAPLAERMWRRPIPARRGVRRRPRLPSAPDTGTVTRAARRSRSFVRSFESGAGEGHGVLPLSRVLGQREEGGPRPGAAGRGSDWRGPWRSTPVGRCPGDSRRLRPCAQTRGLEEAPLLFGGRRNRKVRRSGGRGAGRGCRGAQRPPRCA